METIYFIEVREFHQVKRQGWSKTVKRQKGAEYGQGGMVQGENKFSPSIPSLRWLCRQLKFAVDS